MENKNNQYIQIIFQDDKLIDSLMNYLDKKDIYNLTLCSKEINSKLTDRNQLLLEIIRESRVP
jgi:hypothetical protein